MNDPEAPDAPEPPPPLPPQIVPPFLPPPLPSEMVPAKAKAVFNTPVLILCCILGSACIVYQAWAYYSRDRLHQLDYPAHTAARIAERAMEYQEAPGPLPWLEYVIARLTGNTAQRSRSNAIRICEDVIENRVSLQLTTEDEAGLRVVLGVMLSEARRTNALSKMLGTASGKDSGQHIALLRQLYLTNTPANVRIAEMLPRSSVIGDWTRSRLEIRAARLAGNSIAASNAENDLRERGEAAHRRELAVLLVVALGSVAGLSVIVFALKTAAGSTRAERWPAVWRLRDAVGVFMLAEFLGMLVSWGTAYVEVEPIRSVFTYVYLLMPLVVLLFLARGFLFRWHGLQLREEFRVTNWRVTLAGAVALFACEFIGAAIMLPLIEHWASASWAEGVNEYLIYDPPLARAAILLNMSVIGPCLEEFQMRRIIYGTLRTHAPVWASATLSATLFSFLHFYSFAGFVSVWWFGFSSALIYERTRSLPACIGGHCLTNIVLGLHEILWLA